MPRAPVDEICIHGNSKSSNSEYVRTATDVMANIQEKVQNTETTGSVHDTNIKWINISTTGLETSSKHQIPTKQSVSAKPEVSQQRGRLATFNVTT